MKGLGREKNIYFTHLIHNSTSKHVKVLCISYKLGNYQIEVVVIRSSALTERYIVSTYTFPLYIRCTIFNN